MGHELLLLVEFFCVFTLVGEVDAAGNSLRVCLFAVLVCLSLFHLHDRENLNAASCLCFFLRLLNLLRTVDDCLSLWLCKEVFLSLGTQALFGSVQLLDVECEHFLGMGRSSVELDFEAGIVDSACDSKVLEVLLQFKEKVDVVATCEERCLFPDLSVVFVQFVVGVLTSELGKMFSFFFFAERCIVGALLGTTSYPVSGVGVPLVSLLLTLVVRFFIDDVFSSFELDLYLLVRRVRSLHPWVCHDFFELQSLLGIEDHHLLEEILELSGVNVLALFCVLVCLPEDFATVTGQ